MKYLLTVCLLIICNYSFAQLHDGNLQLKVLIANKVGKEFKFKNDGLEHLKYLGIITSKKHTIYKILTSIWIWGISHHATSRIIVYNSQNKYLGNYYLGTAYDLPTLIKHNFLVFKNTKGASCDSEIQTRIDFKNGPPKTLFIKCTSSGYSYSGDEYSFDTEPIN